MAHNLKVVYDERDTLEAWIPEFDVGPEYDREPGPYEMFSNARLKGADSALAYISHLNNRIENPKNWQMRPKCGIMDVTD